MWQTRDKSHCPTSSVSSMECGSLWNTATDRARLLSMSDQVQGMNGIPSHIAAGPVLFRSVEYLNLGAYFVLLSGVFPVATEGRRQLPSSSGVTRCSGQVSVICV